MSKRKREKEEMKKAAAEEEGGSGMCTFMFLKVMRLEPHPTLRERLA